MGLQCDLFDGPARERLLESVLQNLDQIRTFGGVRDGHIRRYLEAKVTDDRQPFSAAPILHWKKGMRHSEEKLHQFVLIPIGKVSGLCETDRYLLLQEIKERFETRYPRE